MPCLRSDVEPKEGYNLAGDSTWEYTVTVDSTPSNIEPKRQIAEGRS